MKVTIEKIDETYVFVCDDGTRKAGKFYEVLNILKELFSDGSEVITRKTADKKKIKRK